MAIRDHRDGSDNGPNWQERAHQPAYHYSNKAQETASRPFEPQKCLLLSARIPGSAFHHLVELMLSSQDAQKRPDQDSHALRHIWLQDLLQNLLLGTHPRQASPKWSGPD